MPITRADLIAQRSPDRKVIYIKPATHPNGPAIGTHFCSGPHAADALSNAAAHTQLAALYDLAKELGRLQTSDPNVIALQRQARSIGWAIARVGKALSQPAEPE